MRWDGMEWNRVEQNRIEQNATCPFPVEESDSWSLKHL